VEETWSVPTAAAAVHGYKRVHSSSEGSHHPALFRIRSSLRRRPYCHRTKARACHCNYSCSLGSFPLFQGRHASGNLHPRTIFRSRLASESQSSACCFAAIRLTALLIDTSVDVFASSG
jgi:hypothetical protein